MTSKEPFNLEPLLFQPQNLNGNLYIYVPGLCQVNDADTESL